MLNLLLFMQIVFFSQVQCQEQFLAASLYVTNNTRVASGDTLYIVLPTGVTFRNTTSPTCTTTTLSFSSCTIVNTTTGKIVFSVSSTISTVEGTISNFINPDSVRTISGIAILLMSGSTTTIKAYTYMISLSNFQYAILGSATLVSTSTVVGATNVNLNITITPSTRLKATGYVILTIPTYYQNAGSSYMIGSTSPTCTGEMTGVTITVSSCTFSGSSFQASVLYSISSGADTNSSLKIIITTFKNPISTQAKSGFSIQTQDSSGNLIEQSSTLTLTGITSPASFSSYSLSLVDSSVIQTYTGIQLRLSLAVPVEQNCYMKITFPSDFTLDGKLANIVGSGMFSPSSSSSLVQATSIDLTNKIIIIPACSYQYGVGQTGVLTFNQVKNPQQVKSTGNFLIDLAKDSAFTVDIAQITSSQALFIPASTFTSGTISSISVAAVNSNMIQTATNYSITFTPQHGLPASTAVIAITFPNLITLPTSGCSITGKSTSFAVSSIGCSFSGQTVSVTSPFDSAFSGSASLFLNISYGYNPQSQRDAGTFSISTYIAISGTNYLVDSGTSSTGQIIPVGGEISKSADIVVVQPTTYIKDQTYTFSLLMQHLLPQNGFLIFTLPSDISISSTSLVQSNCINLANNNNMNCKALSTTQVKITIDSSAFTNGISIGSVFKFSVSGFKNPRTTQTTGIFYFNSYDQDMMQIDASTSIDYFNVAMTGLSSITSITVDLSNTTNYATTSYTFTVTPNTPILSGDQIQIQFPSQVLLPQANSLSCTGDGTLLISIACSKSSSTTIDVVFSSVGSIPVGQQFVFSVANVRNPISTKPTSPFTNIQITTTSGYGVSTYSNSNLIVTTDTSSYIWTQKLTQSNKNPSAIATYTIIFTTLNALPNTTAILVTAPSIITLNQDATTCYVALASVYQNVCTISQQLIKIQNAFASLTSDYTGEVSIVFQATNPGDNSNLQSIILRSYTDSTYTYRINRIESGLNPSLECNFPCMRCDQNNPDYCTDCFTTDATFPQYIQAASDGSQTCVYTCSTGYTSNGSSGPKTCTACDPKCSSCAQNDQVGDIYKCTQCSNAYPFYYATNNTCQTACFDGQYKCKTLSCCDCQAPCNTCASPTLCKTCNLNSVNPLLWIDKCLATCPTGYTRVGFNCIQCTSPCSTCEDGLPQSCLTCDGKNSLSILFGRQCVSGCPDGTTPIYSNTTQSYCKGCVSGCLSCDSIDNSICLRCNSTLALFNNQCISECPFNYVKSLDGTVCELRTYLLDSSLVYFPFAGCAVIALMISLTAFIVSKKRSLIISNAVALLGVIELAALMYQIYYAYTYTVNYTIIYLVSFGIFCGLYALNIAFSIFYCSRIQHSDIAFNYWRQKYFCTTIFILMLSVLTNFKIFRLLYSRFFGLERFSANIDDKHAFAKKVQIFSFISLFTFTLPLIILDVLILYYLSWGSQLYITCAESGGIALIGGLLMIFDNCCMCTRLSYQDERALAKAKRRAKQTTKQMNLSKSNDFLVMGELGPEDEESKLQIQDREEALKNILSQIKHNRDLFNNDRIEQLLKTEKSHKQTDDDQNGSDDPQNKFIRRVKSMQTILVNVPQELRGEDERKTQSLDSSILEENKKMIQGQSIQFNRSLSQSSLEKRKILFKRDRFVEKLQLDYKFDNVYVDVKDPPPPPPPPVIIPEKPTMLDFELQTDQVSNHKSRSSHKSFPNRENSMKAVDNAQVQNSIESYNESLQQQKRQKKKKQRGKSKNPYYTQINEEEDEEQLSLGDDADTQREFLKTAYEHENEESDLEQIQNKSSGKTIQGNKSNKTLKSIEKLISDKSIRSRSSKNNNSFSMQQIIMSQQSEKQLINKFQQLEILQNQYEQQYFNQRTFNINDIIGEFVRNFKGGILNKREQIMSNNLRDMKGRPVNRRGYLIDENVGCIINKDNLNLMFKREEINEEDGDIPMPYKFERFNFNPHEILGNFDYDTKNNMRPIILKNKQGQLVDKHLRPVNASGFLIDEMDNIVDNFGKIKFVREQLNELGDLPPLFNYKGKQFDIRSIIGIFNRDSITKQIILQQDPYDHQTQIDKLSRRVNPNGYLVDRMGNIINREGGIVFFKSQLLFNEPPKIFPFMKFKFESILGNLIYDENRMPIFESYQVKEENFTGKTVFYDLNGRSVNRLGYLVDSSGNVIDQKGNVVFQKELLVLDDIKRPNQIPKLFRLDVLYSRDKYMIPQVQDDQQQQNSQDNVSRYENNSQLQEHLEALQQTSKFSNILDPYNQKGVDDQYQNTIGNDQIININVSPHNSNKSLKNSINTSPLNQLKEASDKQFSQQNLIQDFDVLAQDQQMDGEEVKQLVDPLQLFDEVLSDPEPVMEKFKQLDKKKKRKQSANKATKQQRQGEKVLNAYSINRPISSYLPQTYQNRAKSNAKERLIHINPQSTVNQHNYNNNIEFSDYSTMNKADQRTRILSSNKSGANMTSNFQSNSGIFKQNAISALGFTEDFSNKNQFMVKKNQYMISNNDQSDDQSYNNYLEGDVDQYSNQANNFNFNPQNQMDERLNRRVQGGPPQQQRIRQNESQMDKVYIDEVNRYVDQTDEEEDESIFNENFNVGRDHRARPQSRTRGRTNLKMYQNDLRLDSPGGSNDSQLSLKGQAHLYRSKKQLLRMDSKLKNLESIYLQQPNNGISSVKNSTLNRGGMKADMSMKKIPKAQANQGKMFRGGAQNERDSFQQTQSNLPRAISPLESRSGSQLQYGRRRGSNF